MDTTIRVSVGAGLGAFGLSVIVALFSRIPLGVSLLRGLGSGLIFAVLIFGLGFILRKFLPELFDETIQAAQGSDDVGNVVDIVLPAEEPDSMLYAPAGSQAADDGSISDSGDSSGALPVSSQMGKSMPMGAPNTGELERDVLAIGRDSMLDGGSGQAGVLETKRLKPLVTMDQLDVLPDLESMSDAFSSVSDIPGASGYDGPDYGGSATHGGTSSGGQDPAAIARAVRTLLRKDQKGQ